MFLIKLTSFNSLNEKSVMPMQSARTRKMERFEHLGKELVFWKYTGVVLGNNKYRDNAVNAKRGGGHIGRFVNNDAGYIGGNIEAPRITSRTILHQEFWLKTNDGQGFAIELKDSNAPVRDGQELTLIYAGKNGNKYGQLFVLVNHNTGDYHYMSDPRKLCEKRLFRMTGMSLIVSAAIVVGTLIVGLSWILSLGALGVFLFIRTMIVTRKLSNIERQLKFHIRNNILPDILQIKHAPT